MIESRRRRSTIALMVLSAAAAMSVGGRARGQSSRTGFAINRFEPAERGGGFFALDALDVRGAKDGGLRPAVGATFDYAYKPLIVEDPSRVEQFALVRHQLFVHLGASAVFADRYRVGVNVPIALAQDGEPGFVEGELFRAATAPAFGDVRLAFDARLVGRRTGEGSAPFIMALGLRGWLPTGLRSQFSSDGSARVSPHVLTAGDIGPLTWSARLALAYRARDDAYAGTSLGSEMIGQTGLALRMLSDRLRVGPELWASSVLTKHFLGDTETTATAVVGVHVEILRGLRAAAGIGSGLGRGYGSAQLRALLSIEWAAPADEPSSFEHDRDHDGVLDDVDACPDKPGVRDADPITNGCPAPAAVPLEDTDHDGISDMDDACPGLVGVKTTDPMTNGCPPETTRPLAVATKAEIKIGEQLHFAKDSDELTADASNDALLSAVKRIFDEHADIRRVRVEGHTDAQGDAAYNDQLSARRAAAVTKWLTEHGVSADRLESAGFGSRRPIDSNDTEAGRAKNRRVTFTIVERVDVPKR